MEVNPYQLALEYNQARGFSEDEKYANHFIETWRRIARRFRGREGLYGYDLINEPSQRLGFAR